MANRRQTARILIASLVGTAVEFYDFYIYATAASLVFGPLFFPASSASAQLLAVLCQLRPRLPRPADRRRAVRPFRRPDRAQVDARRVADADGRVDRCRSRFLPTYAMVGWIAPLLLCLLRFGQGFGLGGEWGGAALLAVENAPPGWRARFGMLPQLGAPVGFIAANGFFLLLGAVADAPISSATGAGASRSWPARCWSALGLWVRLKLDRDRRPSPPRWRRRRRRACRSASCCAIICGATIAGTFGVVACFALYLHRNRLRARLWHHDAWLCARRRSCRSQLGAILFMAAGILIAGWLADRTSPSRVLMIGCVGTIASGAADRAAAGRRIDRGGVFVFLAVALLVMGFVYGPLGAWLPGLFPPRVRYTGVSRWPSTSAASSAAG